MLATLEYGSLVATDLVLRAQPPPPQRVRLYVDEVKPSANAHGEIWMYVGVLAIVEQHQAQVLALLNTDRQRLGCNSEMHFSKLTSHGSKAHLAEAWLHHVLYDPDKLIHFNVLGINVSRIHRASFGDHRSSQDRRIYTRFLRSAVIYALKYFFPGPVEVTRIFHDSGDLEHDPYFDWHAPWRIAKDYEGVRFIASDVLFVNSDHRVETRFPEDSHLIQLTDLVVGSVRQVLDSTSEKPIAVALADQMMPLLDRIMDDRRRRNPHSRYSHLRRCNVSFFPSKSIALGLLDDSFERYRSCFFRYRRPLQQHEGVAQLDLGFDL